MMYFLRKISLRPRSACKIGKHFLIKLLIVGKMEFYDVKNLTASVLKTLLRGFLALSREIWEIF